MPEIPKWSRTSNSEIATRNERAGDGEHLRGREGNIEGLGDGTGAAEDVQDRLVTGFDCRDGSRVRQENGVVQKVGCTKVGSDTEVLYHSGGSNHGGHVRQDRVEVKLAPGRRGSTQGLECRLEGS